MRILSIFLMLVSFSSLIAQSNTEVYLFDLKKNNNSFELSNQRNISNNEGYDNQPSFYNDNIVLFLRLVTIKQTLLLTISEIIK